MSFSNVMRLFRLKTSRLALILATVTLAAHLGIGLLVTTAIKIPALAELLARSVAIYWPALSVVQVLVLSVHVGNIWCNPMPETRRGRFGSRHLRSSAG